MIPVQWLMVVTAVRARLLGLTRDERGDSLRTILTDYMRRSGRRRDRRQPAPPCTLVPSAGVRLHVLATSSGRWRYELRRAWVRAGSRPTN